MVKSTTQFKQTLLLVVETNAISYKNVFHLHVLDMSYNIMVTIVSMH